jgi:hypothetical protein
MWAWKPVRQRFGAHGRAQKERYPPGCQWAKAVCMAWRRVLLAGEAAHGIVDEHRIELAE